MAESLVGYLRVSTRKQEASGLGLEAQRAAVEAHAQRLGARVSAWYLEVETGTHDQRPELARALAHARRARATLCVARLDRLSRDVEFVARILNSGAEFVAVDNPVANRLTLHVLSAVAENEARLISERTRAALAAAKARGALLGSARPGHWDGREEARKAGAAKGAVIAARVRAEKADQAYSDLYDLVTRLRDEGLSLQDIADSLNENGHTTRRGKPWNPVQVSRVLARAPR